MNINFPNPDTYSSENLLALARQFIPHNSQAVDFNEVYENKKSVLVGKDKKRFVGIGLDETGGLVIKTYDPALDITYYDRPEDIEGITSRQLERIYNDVLFFCVLIDHEELMVSETTYQDGKYQVIDVFIINRISGNRNRDYLASAFFANAVHHLEGEKVTVKNDEYIIIGIDPGLQFRVHKTGDRIPADELLNVYDIPPKEAKKLADKLRKLDII